MLCFAILVLDPSLLLKGAASMSWEASDKQGGRKAAGPQLEPRSLAQPGTVCWLWPGSSWFVVLD